MLRRMPALAMTMLTLVALTLALFAAQVHGSAMLASDTHHGAHQAVPQPAAAHHGAAHAPENSADRSLHHGATVASCEGGSATGAGCLSASALCGFVCTGLGALPFAGRIAGLGDARREPYLRQSPALPLAGAPLVDQRPPIAATL